MKSLFRCASWFPRLLAGEGVQGAALVLPRTPAARLACFDIKIQISGGCLNGATQERSEFRRTSRLQARLFFPPFLLATQKKWGRLSGRNPTSCLKPSTPPKQEAATAPSPPSPSGGRSECGPHPSPLPQAGEGVQGTALVPPRTPAVRLACLDIKNLISGCLFDQSDAGATGVQPDKPPARLAFSFPHFFWRRKRNGVGCRAETRLPPSAEANRSNKKQERPPSLPSPNGGRRKASSPPKKRTFQTAEQLTQN